MAYRKLVLPSARKEFDWFCKTYGDMARVEAQGWVDSLVSAAEVGIRKLLGVSTLDEVLKQIQNSPEAAYGQWWYSIRRFADADFSKKI